MRTILLLTITFFVYTLSLAQTKEGLKYDDTKFSLGASYPFGVNVFMMNIKNKYGAFVNVMSTGKQPIEDDNFISQWHELTIGESVNKFNVSLGGMYRVWKPFHVYLGVGLGFSKYQEIWIDQPPVVLKTAYRIRRDKFKPLLNAGVVVSLWRITAGVGYDTHIDKTIFSLAYTMKI